MLRTRRATPEDLEEIRKLHEMYYSEFDFPDFYRLMNAFVITDDGEIVMAGGVEPVGEAVLVTNKAKSRIKIGKALVIAQGACAYACKEANIRELNAFVNNHDYARHLIKHGFEPRFEHALMMRIPNGKEEHES